MTAAAAGAASAASSGAAAAKRAQDQEEEELMTPYGDRDLDGWEFKIVRSPMGKFKKPEVFAQVCEEEARSGWALLEKFDNSRLRFKRPVSERERDFQRESDPYRTIVGASDATIGLWVVLGILTALGLLGAIAAVAAS